MKKIIIVLTTIMVISVGFCSVTNTVEEIKTCPKCNGSGQLVVYDKCGVCGGRGMTTRESRTNLRGHIEYNDIRCTACGMSPKLGMIKRYTTCTECNGDRKVKTGRILTKIVYTKEELKERESRLISKQLSVGDQNKKLIERQKKIDTINGMKKVKDAMDKQYKKLTLKDDTEETREKKMYLRKRIQHYSEEIRRLERQL